MMEPVARLREFLSEPDDIKEAVLSFLSQEQMDVLRKFVGQQTSYERIAELERERDVWRAKSGGIAELQSQVDNHANWTASMQHGLDRGKELLAAAIARAEAAEALLKEATRLLKTLRPNSNGWDCDEDSACDWIDAFVSRADKIGVKDE